MRKHARAENKTVISNFGMRAELSTLGAEIHIGSVTELPALNEMLPASIVESCRRSVLCRQGGNTSSRMKPGKCKTKTLALQRNSNSDCSEQRTAGTFDAASEQTPTTAACT